MKTDERLAASSQGRAQAADLSDVGIIDRIGVARIAEALGISKQGVRKWRRGGIPGTRKEALRLLLAATDDQVAMVPDQVARGASKVLQATTKASVRTRMPAQPKPKPLDPAATCPVMKPGPARGGGIAEMNAFIAARNVEHARAHATRTSVEAKGLPPMFPVRGYKGRLAMLFALDFPILTMAFVAVTQASPIVAAGSAVALSLFLVLGAHGLGGPLRGLAMHLPAWGRHLAAVVVMLALLGAVIGVTIDLRIKGFDIEALFNGHDRGSLVFGGSGGDVGQVLPESFQWAIVRAAGLVTLLATVFGVSWSYRQHSPQADFARAEAAYQKSLRRYARCLTRLSGKTAVTVAAMIAACLLPVADARAEDCRGPTTLALVDTTTAYDDEDRTVIMSAVDAMVGSLAPESRLVIRTVRESSASSRLLFDSCVPADGRLAWSLAGVWDWLTSDPASLRTERRLFIGGVRDIMLPELHGAGDAVKTALLDTLVRHAGEADRLSDIWLFTDLLESASVPVSRLLSSSASLMEGGHNLPALTGVNVHVAGIGRFHDRKRRPLTPLELGTLIDAWTALIQSAGGRAAIIGRRDAT